MGSSPFCQIHQVLVSVRQTYIWDQEKRKKKMHGVVESIYHLRPVNVFRYCADVNDLGGVGRV